MKELLIGITLLVSIPSFAANQTTHVSREIEEISQKYKTYLNQTHGKTLFDCDIEYGQDHDYGEFPFNPTQDVTLFNKVFSEQKIEKIQVKESGQPFMTIISKRGLKIKHSNSKAVYKLYTSDNRKINRIEVVETEQIAYKPELVLEGDLRNLKVVGIDGKDGQEVELSRTVCNSRV